MFWKKKRASEDPGRAPADAPQNAPREQRIDLAALEEGDWTLFTATRSEKREVLLVNSALRGFEHPEVFAWHLSVCIHARDVRDDGMPEDDDQKALDAVGDAIEAAVLADRTELGAPNALSFARSTWNGLRELMFRVHDPEIANATLQGLLAKGGAERPWEFRMESDPDWSLTAPILALYPTS